MHTTQEYMKKAGCISQSSLKPEQGYHRYFLCSESFQLYIQLTFIYWGMMTF